MGRPNDEQVLFIYLDRRTCPAVPGLSVADARVRERAGRTLVFRVTLDPKAAGTATAGQDYTVAARTMTFAVGETEQTVAVLEDAHDEGEETLAFTLSKALGS